MTTQMSEALLKWLSTFKTGNAPQVELKTWNDVSDGVAMAKVLHKIDSTHFNIGKIKHLVGSRQGQIGITWGTFDRPSIYYTSFII